MIKITLILLLCFVQGGCFWGLFSDDIVVTVNNHTDATIKVMPKHVYADEIYKIQDEFIGSGGSHVFYIEGVDFDPEILVEYKGYKHLYDIDIDFWGYDEINVEGFHFVNSNG